MMVAVYYHSIFLLEAGDGSGPKFTMEQQIARKLNDNNKEKKIVMNFLWHYCTYQFPLGH